MMYSFISHTTTVPFCFFPHSTFIFIDLPETYGKQCTVIVISASQVEKALTPATFTG